jgi:hypothetical protein
VNIANINANSLHRGPQIVQKSWRYLRILGAKSVAGRTSYTGDPRVLGVTQQTLLARATWLSGFVYSWAYSNFTEQYASGEANRPRREIPCVLWNPKLCYRIHNSLTLATVLIQMKQVHSRAHSFLTTCCNIISSAVPVSRGLLFPFESS